MDFVKIKVVPSSNRNSTYDFMVRPGFVHGDVKDLITRGGVFYAFWNGDHWSTDLNEMAASIDREVYTELENQKKLHPDMEISVGTFRDDDSGIRKKFENYTKLQQTSDKAFNTTIFFKDDEVERDDYATTKLDYNPTPGESPNFDYLLESLYDEEEIEKILWFMGATLTNSMHKIQKFMYLYGGKGTGKGTVIDIFKRLFQDYYAEIDLAKLTGGGEFATSQIQELPVLVDADSDISRIKQDVNLLKLTAHEPLTVNQKYQKQYEVTFGGLLITASNQRYQVANIDSGINRRAVVVKPKNGHIPYDKYKEATEKIKYELPAIADRAIKWFGQEGPAKYENEVDIQMMENTDHIFSFVRETAVTLGDTVTLKKAAELYKLYLEDIGFDTRGYKRKIKVELQRYYKEFYEQMRIDGAMVKNVFVGFKHDLVFPDEQKKPVDDEHDDTMVLEEQPSVFNSIAKDYPAQLANADGNPKMKWDNVQTVLKDIDSRKLHYVQVPMNHIVIDLDLRDKEGNKDLNKNLEAAKLFPDTYAELSQSGNGLHLHYLYDGDPSELSSIYKDNIEIKVYSGKQALRRRLSKCNDLNVEHIGTGLPLKKKKVEGMYKDVSTMTWTEKTMKSAIENNLMKKYHADTTSSMHFIEKIFNDAEAQGLKYDMRGLQQSIMVFASKSTNHAKENIKIAAKLKYTNQEEETNVVENKIDTRIYKDEELYFYDIEVFPNVLIVVYKKFGDDHVTTLFNPSSEQIEEIMSKPLVGFNVRRYDNHIMYGRLLGETNLQLFQRSQKIINGTGGGFVNNAYDLHYADIYEYTTKKQSLKKWEVELNLIHDEFEFPFDQPLDKSLWDRAAEYCANDVFASEKVFLATKEDYDAKLILSIISGTSPSTTTRFQAQAWLFGDDKRPQEKFVYTDLSTIFPGYKFEFGKSSYMGEDPSEGGYVYSEPGVYKDVMELDVESMHPSSAINLNYFGPYTKRYEDLKTTRIYVKHHEFDKASEMFGGALKPYLNEDTADALAYALKIIINIVYGLSSAKFDNAFRHPKNVDNIIAKRGALFMITLKHKLQDAGYKVIHIKTDSIKVPNIDDKAVELITDFGKEYGYNIAPVHVFEKMALVNKAVLIGKVEENKRWKDSGKWEAVGAQFADPFVFKTLFSHESLDEKDFAETKEVKSHMYLGEKFIGRVAEVYASKTGEELKRANGDGLASVTGTKGYQWKLFSEYGGKDDVDMSYYDHKIVDAIEKINKVGSSVELVPTPPTEYQQYLLPF